MKKINREARVRTFHQAAWNEPIIFELNAPGERGILVPDSGEMGEQTGKAAALIPDKLRRHTPPALPEVSQHRVLRHYLRVSQECLGADLNVEIGQGTCTMKYSPKVNERLARLPDLAETHPLQPEDTLQGTLKIMYETAECLKDISGMDYVSFQPQSGGQALMTMSALVRAKVQHDGLWGVKDEIITTQFSHPSAAASAIVMGFKIRTIGYDDKGYPSLEDLKAAVSERTAGFICANPEDTGLYNFRVKEFTDLIHSVGGVCCYDQANANGLFGIARARDAGFDMCFFNLHKSFSTPHGCGGPGTGALCVSAPLKDFMPAPLVAFDGQKYTLDGDLPHSIGKVRQFYGVPEVVVKTYAWLRSMGPEGLRAVAETAVLNNNYLYSRVMKIRGVTSPFDPASRRLEQNRYSLEPLFQDTGVDTSSVGRRMADFGFHYWSSHHPFIVPNPATLEPTESPSKADIDEYVDTLAYICEEAYTNPEAVKTAPHNSCVHVNDEAPLDDPDQWAITWRSYLKKTQG